MVKSGTKRVMRYLSVTRAFPPSHDGPSPERTCPSGQSGRQTSHQNQSYNLKREGKQKHSHTDPGNTEF